MAGTKPGHDGVGSRDTCCKTRSAPLPSSKRWRNRPRTPSSSCPGARRRSLLRADVPGIHVLSMLIKRRTSDGRDIGVKQSFVSRSAMQRRSRGPAPPFPSAPSAKKKARREAGLNFTARRNYFRTGHSFIHAAGRYCP